MLPVRIVSFVRHASRPAAQEVGKKKRRPHTLNNIEAAAGLAVGILVGASAGITLDKDGGAAKRREKNRQQSNWAAAVATANTSTYPLGRVRRKSLRGPSAKLVTRNQEVWRLSLGPELLATAYLMISRPDWVGTTSGVSARLPMMEMRAMARGDEVVKERLADAEGAATRRKSMEDILCDFFRLEYACACCVRD